MREVNILDVQTKFNAFLMDKWMLKYESKDWTDEDEFYDNIFEISSAYNFFNKFIEETYLKTECEQHREEFVINEC